MRADSQKLDITSLENVVVRLDEGLRRYLTDVSADARQDQSYL